MKIFFRNFLIVLFFAIPALLTAGAFMFWFYMDKPYGDRENIPVIVNIPRGMSFQELSDELVHRGLVHNADYLLWRYKISVRLGIAGNYQAGRYSLKPGLKPSEIIQAITSPSNEQRFYIKLLIPPGLTSSQIAQIVEEADIALSEDVKDAIVLLASEYPILQTENGLQGYLFPDTYKIEPLLDTPSQNSKQAAEAVIRIMADRFFRVLDEIYPSWNKLTRMQLHEKIILASIVEREYRAVEEAPIIAAVFNNRLKEGMLLQSCATVVYTIEETSEGEPFKGEYLRFNRRIFEQYLEIDSPYNTYMYSNLPPGPISLAGRTALEAAFYPASVDYLYFVVKDPAKGTHVFSRDYFDHLTARSSYLNQFVVKE
ncbi:MAG: hypothetical protein B0D92_08575 [Spirochaeta sp. LUC14_002_19_P3]|nr:MAG: hypothetical protein B0D92_08575 [Spirochaeta sp. LUC14_002_19_P3]